MFLTWAWLWFSCRPFLGTSGVAAGFNWPSKSFLAISCKSRESLCLFYIHSVPQTEFAHECSSGPSSIWVTCSELYELYHNRTLSTFIFYPFQLIEQHTRLCISDVLLWCELYCDPFGSSVSWWLKWTRDTTGDYIQTQVWGFVCSLALDSSIIWSFNFRTFSHRVVTQERNTGGPITQSTIHHMKTSIHLMTQG